MVSCSSLSHHFFTTQKALAWNSAELNHLCQIQIFESLELKLDSFMTWGRQDSVDSVKTIQNFIIWAHSSFSFQISNARVKFVYKTYQNTILCDSNGWMNYWVGLAWVFKYDAPHRTKKKKKSCDPPAISLDHTYCPNYVSNHLILPVESEPLIVLFY